MPLRTMLLAAATAFAAVSCGQSSDGDDAVDEDGLPSRPVSVGDRDDQTGAGGSANAGAAGAGGSANG